MTFVLLEHQAKAMRWFASADSRLTDEDGPILDSAPKLFALPIRVFPTLDRPAIPKKPIFQHSIGMAYAGSSLSAFSIFAFASAACQSLMLKEGQQIPTLQDVAELVGRISKIYVGEIWSRFHGANNRGRSEIFVFGFCRQLKKLQAFRITPKLDPKFSVEVVELNGGSNAAYWLGPESVKTAFLKEANKYESTPPSNRPTRSAILESLILSGEHPTIGGVVQCSMADETGAWVLPTLNSADNNIRNAKATFLNVELDSLSPVGGCRIGVLADASRLN